VTSAINHTGRAIVINFDIVNFFPSITVRRVRGIFISLGYSPDAAELLAILCTEHPRSAAVLDCDRIWIPSGPRALPQGACTSPVISNLVARKLDGRLVSVADKLGFSYTRYADDLTFSSAFAYPRAIDELCSAVGCAAKTEGFTINDSKTTEMRAGSRQIVTGIVVNSRPTLPRSEVRRLLAILHRAAQTGLKAQDRDGHKNYEAHMRGLIAHLHSVDPTRAAPLRVALDMVVTSRNAETVGRRGPVPGLGRLACPPIRTQTSRTSKRGDHVGGR
jgi:retron-type reverse transcriptase